jgi:hypothetical protein
MIFTLLIFLVCIRHELNKLFVSVIKDNLWIADGATMAVCFRDFNRCHQALGLRLNYTIRHKNHLHIKRQNKGERCINLVLHGSTA